MNHDYNLLMNKAKEASKMSYSPFSRFAVGAAVLAKSGTIYSGCNVENSSFGMTICAERCAIFKAISEGEKEILAVAIYSPNADEEIDVITENMGELIIRKLGVYLPYGFKI